MSKTMMVVLALGMTVLANIAREIAVPASTPAATKQDFEASCIRQRGMLPMLEASQVVPFCTCAAKKLATTFSAAEFDAMVATATPSEAQQARSSEALLACLVELEPVNEEGFPERPQPAPAGDVPEAKRASGR